MKRRYKKPPVVECLIELFVPPIPIWNEELVKKLYKAEFKNKYPIESHTSQGKFEFKLQGKDRIQHSYTGVARYRYLTKNNSAMIQFGDNMCVYNQLKPYPGNFNKVLKKAEPVISHFLFVTKPKQIEGLGIRYINSIALPSDNLNLEEFFNIYPVILRENMVGKVPFVLQAVVHSTQEEYITVTLSTKGKDKKNNVIFNYDFYGKKLTATKPNLKTIKEWIMRVQGRIEEIFELSIKMPLREKFGIMK